MSNDVAPFKLFQSGPENFSLILAQFAPADAVFEAAGRDGGGYDWEKVARAVVARLGTQVADGVAFDCEASMFSAYGPDREPLAALGAELARLFADHAALAEVVARLPSRRAGSE